MTKILNLQKLETKSDNKALAGSWISNCCGVK